MQIVFDKQYLADLYYEGKADKKHRFQPEIIKGYRRVINTLITVERIEDLYPIRSMNYEKLSGDKAGIESVRVNDKYRVEFKTTIIAGETIVTLCNILELSNHYR